MKNKFRVAVNNAFYTEKKTEQVEVFCIGDIQFSLELAGECIIYFRLNK